MGFKITKWTNIFDCDNHRRIIWRKAIGIDDTVSYEMYMKWYDNNSVTGLPNWVGGGIFKLSMYDDADVKHALDEFGVDKWDVGRDELARYLFICNFADFDSVRDFAYLANADAYFNDLIRTSPWGEARIR